MNPEPFAMESVLLWTAFHGIGVAGAYWFLFRESDDETGQSCENHYGPGDNWERENL